jgi:hypothetical protein
MLRIYDICHAPLQAQAIFVHERFKISCTTITTNPEIRVFTRDFKEDVTDKIMPPQLERGPISATAANIARVVAGINGYNAR